MKIQIVWGLALLSTLQAPAWSDEFVFPMEESWSAVFGPPVADATRMRAHGLGLYLAAPGQRLMRLSLQGGALGSEVEPLPTAGLPQGLELVDLEAVSGAIRLAIAGSVDGRPVVYTSRFGPEMNLEGWEPALALPTPAPETVTALGSVGEFLVVYTDRGPVKSGWIINLGAPAEEQKWVELPLARTPRSGGAALVLEDLMVHAGGVRPDGRGTGIVEIMPFDGLNVTPWKTAPLGTPGVVREVVGASAPQAAFLMPRSADSATSATVYTSFHMGERRMTRWMAMPATRAAGPARSLTFDDANNLLIAMTEESTEPRTARLTAWRISELAQASRPSMEEVEFSRLERLALQIPTVPVDQALLKARDAGRHVLVVLTDGSRRQNAEARGLLGKSTYRYLAAGCEMTHLSGEDGVEAQRRFNVGALPALVLLNAEGGIERTLEGRLPSPGEMVEFTSVTRQPTNKGATP